MNINNLQDFFAVLDSRFVVNSDDIQRSPTIEGVLIRAGGGDHLNAKVHRRIKTGPVYLDKDDNPIPGQSLHQSNVSLIVEGVVVFTWGCVSADEELMVEAWFSKMHNKSVDAHINREHLMKDEWSDIVEAERPYFTNPNPKA